MTINALSCGGGCAGGCGIDVKPANTGHLVVKNSQQNPAPTLFIDLAKFYQSEKKKNMESTGVRDSKTGTLVYLDKVIYSNPCTIAFWTDGTKTTCKCDESDTFNPMTGLAICYMKKACGNEDVSATLCDWTMADDHDVVTFKDVRARKKAAIQAAKEEAEKKAKKEAKKAARRK